MVPAFQESDYAINFELTPVTPFSRVDVQKQKLVIRQELFSLKVKA